MEAEYDWGRWIVNCPDCNGADLAFPGKDQICGSEQALMIKNDIQGRPPTYKVRFPSVKDINIAMEILRLRNVENMNWKPAFESVLDLINENKQHGVI